MDKINVFTIASKLSLQEDPEVLTQGYFFETCKVENHIILDLKIHLERYFKSALFLKRSTLLSLDEIIARLELITLPKTARLRLNFTAHNIWGELSDLPHYPQVLKLGFDDEARVSSSNIFLQHKTNNYALNSYIKAKRTDLDDVLFVNEKKEITETTRANIFYLDPVRNVFVTPPTKSGLLPGIERGKLLLSGTLPHEGKKIKIVEEILLKDAIIPNGIFILTNSLMGFRYGKLS